MRYLIGIFILAFCCEAKYIPEDGIYAVADDMPEYEAGMKAFDAHINDFISASGERGSVFVSFVVTTEGELDRMKVVKSLDKDADSLALAAIEAAPMKWKPGKNDGQPVPVKMVYTIHFKN